jgi:hypothetical protein
VDSDFLHRFSCEVPISGGEVVYLEKGDNIINLADADAPSTSDVIGIASGSSAVVYESGSVVPVFTVHGDRFGGLTGLTAGSVYYLSSTPGAMTTTPSTGGGRMVVRVGIACSATEILMEPEIVVRGLA